LNERLMAVGDSSRVTWRGIEHMPAASSANITWEEQTLINSEVGVIRKRAPEIAIMSPPFRPNTALANRLMVTMHRYGDPDRLCELRAAIYRAYWLHGRDISDLAVLAELCADVRFPFIEPRGDVEARRQLAQWQAEWEGERFHARLPAMLSTRSDKPLLGFPTLDFLYSFFSDDDIPMVPASLASCELKPKQTILAVTPRSPSPFNLVELLPAYRVLCVSDLAAAEREIADRACPPDLLLLDVVSLGRPALDWISARRREPRTRGVPVLALVERAVSDWELAAFDSGATDVVFDLGQAKVCQARVEHHLFMRRTRALLASMARFDYLTELPNRREFDRKLEEEWGRARRDGVDLSVCLIDIDHFKLYNDTYGHTGGDDCLRLVASALQKSARRAGDLVARYGGEEFGVVLPNTGLRAASERAEHICAAVRALGLPNVGSSAAPIVTTSIGVACRAPRGGGMPNELLRAADAALYQAKAGGRNRVEVDEERERGESS
jgi:diguanylate cyclase (GGDEF)-like protein